MDNREQSNSHIMLCLAHTDILTDLIIALLVNRTTCGTADGRKRPSLNTRIEVTVYRAVGAIERHALPLRGLNCP